MICASTVSLPTRVALKRKLPILFMVAPTTSSPACFSTGRLSPVIIDSSTLEAPSRTDDPGRTRRQPDQLFDCLGCLPLGARLQHAPEEDERDDDGCGVEIHRHAQPLRLEEGGEKYARNRVEVSRSAADRHQRVHIGRAVPGGAEGALVETPAHPELHRRRQRPQYIHVVE